MATVQPHPRPYELMTVLLPELGDDDLASQIDRINEQIAAAGGSVRETLRESPWGRRRLAYTIRHNGQDYRDGFYVVTHFTLPPAGTTELERELKLNVQVMRYLLVHDDPKVGERARDPELVVEHSDDPQAVQPAEVAATTAAVLSDPDAVESDAEPASTEAPVAAAEAQPDQTPESPAQEAETPQVDEAPSQPESTQADELPVESQATPPPVNASNVDVETAETTEEPDAPEESSEQQEDEEEREG